MKRFLVATLIALSGCSLAQGERCLTDEEHQAIQQAFGERDEAIKKLAIELEAVIKAYHELKKDN